MNCKIFNNNIDDDKEINFKKKLVIEGYKDFKVIKRYSKIGLWKSENYLISKYFETNNNLSNNKILDIGCGCGRTTIPLKFKGYDVVGIDISYSMIDRAKLIAKEYKLDINFLEMDACNINFESNYFNNVLFSYNGIEHIPTYKQKKQALKEINRVMKPKGYFIFTVHSGFPNLITFKYWLIRNKDSLKAIKTQKIPYKLELGEKYYNRYVPESKYTHIVPIFYWWKWLKEAGFNIIYTNNRRRVDLYKPSSRLSTLFYTFSNFFVCQKF